MHTFKLSECFDHKIGVFYGNAGSNFLQLKELECEEPESEKCAADSDFG